MTHWNNRIDHEYIQAAKLEIEEWESQGPGFLNHLGDFLLIPAQGAAKALIPASVQDAVAKAIHKLLSGLSSAARLISNEGRIRYRIEEASNKHKDELRAADEVAKHYWKWNVVGGMGEGGATGALGLIGLAADVPALLTISLRLVQQIGICYGYDMKSREEQEYVMHVLRIGSTSSLKAKMEALVGLEHIEQILLKVRWNKVSEALARKEISRISLLAAMRQFAQMLGLQLTRRKALQLVPVIGALTGASFNAVFVNDVSRTAFMLYRRRRIAELEGPKSALLDL
jgi:uncharacterized protein (DUF697 family)